MSENQYMDPAQYMKDRVDNQIDWHDRKSGMNKTKYQRYQLTQVVVASLITLSATLSVFDDPWVFFVAPVLGAVVAIVSGVLSLFKFQENWVDYRMTSEQLKKEKYLFITKSEPYTSPDRFKLFVTTIEDILSKQNSKWLRNISEGDPSKDGAQNAQDDGTEPEEQEIK